MMREFTRKSILDCLVVMLAAGSAAWAVTINSSIRTDDESLERCDQIQVRFGEDGDSMPTAKSEETFKVSRSEAAPLVLHLSEAGGIRVQSWDRDDYSVLACKSAAGRSAE